MSYTSFDKPWRVEVGNHTTEFSYNHERQRYKRLDIVSGATTNTLYTGSVEWITGPDGKTEIKRYIGQHLVITMFQDGGIDESLTRLDYLLRDHLGSVTVVLDKQGAITNNLSFDPWGQRRSADWQSVLDMVSGWSDISSYIAITTQGFTGHEMLDQVGLIHMNGRVYDPRLARFLSADPLVQAVGNAQSYNRYSYILNNPLNATDPSGYAVFSIIAGIVAFAEAFTTLEIVVAFTAAGIADALTAGASFSDAVKQGVISGVTAGAFSWAAGLEFGGLGEFAGGAARVGTVATVGGVTQVLAGGKFGHGFVAAGLGASVSYIPGLGGPSNWARVSRVLVSAVVGGTASEITGGKFANGAATGAFAATFAEVAQPSDASSRQGGEGESYGGEEAYDKAIEALNTNKELSEIVGTRKNFEYKDKHYVSKQIDGRTAYKELGGASIDTSIRESLDAFNAKHGGGWGIADGSCGKGTVCSIYRGATSSRKGYGMLSRGRIPVYESFTRSSVESVLAVMAHELVHFQTGALHAAVPSRMAERAFGRAEEQAINIYRGP